VRGWLILALAACSSARRDDARTSAPSAASGATPVVSLGPVPVLPLPAPSTGGCPTTCAPRTDESVAKELGWAGTDPVPCGNEIGDVHFVGRFDSHLECSNWHMELGCCPLFPTDDSAAALARLGWKGASLPERIALAHDYVLLVDDAIEVRDERLSAASSATLADGGVALELWIDDPAGAMDKDFLRIRWEIDDAGHVTRRQLQAKSLP
jgi:hypothetical protein